MSEHSTTLDADFLLAVLRMAEFRGEKLLAAKAGLLSLALRGQDFTAADLPAELTEGSKHRAGAATGSLIALGLLICVDRIKSPKPSAKGRRLDVLRLGVGKYGVVLAWFRANGIPVPGAGQQATLGLADGDVMRAAVDMGQPALYDIWKEVKQEGQ